MFAQTFCAATVDSEGGGGRRPNSFFTYLRNASWFTACFLYVSLHRRWDQDLEKNKSDDHTCFVLIVDNTFVFLIINLYFAYLFEHANEVEIPFDSIHICRW